MINKKLFSRRIIEKKALKNINISINKGEILALIGESGSGKSTLSNIIIGITDYIDGEVFVLNKNMNEIGKKELNILRKNVQMIFQNPYMSFDLKKTIRYSLTEPLLSHKIVQTKKEAYKFLEKEITKYGLDIKCLNRFPYQVSGGQLQRVSIMRGLILNPELLICDEIISALDVELQLQIIKIIKDLSQKKDLTCLFVTHNLASIKNFADKIAVMKDGEIIEVGSTKEIFLNPKYKYTKELIDSIPKFN